MSLLMDALRKAEEAKKKAAQEAKSEDTAATANVQEERTSAADEIIPEDSPSPETELSMADMEEVPARSAVSNLETPIEFEDEEDYVLPTSVGAPSLSDRDSEEAEPAAEQDVSDPIAVEREAEQEMPADVAEEPWGDTDSTSAEPEIAAAVQTSTPEPIGIDDLEGEGMGQAEGPEVEETPTPERAEPGRIHTPASSVALGNSDRPGARDRGVDRDESGQRAARNVFAAKKSRALSKRTVQIATGGGVFILLVAVGTYFYISLNQESAFNIPAGSYIATEFVDDGGDFEADDGPLVSDTVEQADAIGDTSAADAGTPGLASLDTVNDVAGDSSVLEELLSDSDFPEVIAATEPSPSAADIQPETLVIEAPQPEVVVTTVDDAPLANAEVETEAEAAIAASPEPVQPATTIEPENLISFRRQQNVTAVDPNLDLAYAAYQRGSLDEAEELYRRALASDPLQRDALLGLATIAARSGSSAEALDLYSRMLARNPRDPIARAGLMEILPAGSPANQEADLKRLLNEYPNVAPLAYAYGNFLASNQRWSEAQQAYFRALQLAKSDAALSGRVNPDYAFNLAVSLEHLNQGQPAQNYYREALAFAANHPAGFDLAAVRSRLASMAGEQ